MENELVERKDVISMIEDINRTENLCAALMRTKHYEKMGREGVFAIIQKANSLGIQPIEALNGGMYYVQGKVELSAIMMAKLIRQKKHSITMDKTSTDTNCILHGKRADNGDTWRASFSISDAKRAGIYKEGGPWSKYPDVMCYNRALSKLARQLFPDVIGNCYIEGELIDVETIESSNVKSVITQDVNSCEPVSEKITKEQATRLEMLLDDDAELKDNVLSFVQSRFGQPDLMCIPQDYFQTLFDRVNARYLQKRQTEDASIEKETPHVSQ